MAKNVTVVGTSDGQITVTNTKNQGIPVIIANPQDLPSGGEVTSVNGKKGVVVLDARDIKSTVNGGNNTADQIENIMWNRIGQHDVRFEETNSRVDTAFNDIELANDRIDEAPTKSFVEETYAPFEYVDNSISNVKLNDLVDVNINDSSFNLLVHNPVTHIVESVDMVTENLNSNNIKSYTLAQTLAVGENIIKYNLTPAEIDGVLFEPVATGIKITQPTNGISLSGKLTLFPVNVNVGWPLDVNVKVMKGTTIIAEKSDTLKSSAGYELNLTPTTVDATFNDIISVKVTYANNPANPVIKLNGTGFLQLYNSNETAIKFPNAHLQSDYYVGGSINNITLTSNDQVIISRTISENVVINPRHLSGRVVANRTGGGNALGNLFVVLFKNGVQLGEETQFTLARDDSDTITADNIKRFNFAQGDLLEVKAAYVGSGTTSLTGGSYSIVGKKI